MEFVFVPDQCLSFYFLLMGLANRVLLKPVPWGGRGGGVVSGANFIISHEETQFSEVCNFYFWL